MTLIFSGPPKESLRGSDVWQSASVNDTRQPFWHSNEIHQDAVLAGGIHWRQYRRMQGEHDPQVRPGVDSDDR